MFQSLFHKLMNFRLTSGRTLALALKADWLISVYSPATNKFTLVPAVSSDIMMKNDVFCIVEWILNLIKSIKQIMV